jgi:hypothetical protein
MSDGYCLIIRNLCQISYSQRTVRTAGPEDPPNVAPLYLVAVVGTPFATRNAGLAPARGRNFWPPPLSTSAT